MRRGGAPLCLRCALLCVVLAALAGCGVSTTEEVKAWLDQERKLLGAATTTFAPPNVFVPEAYALAEREDPFGSARLGGLDPSAPRAPGAGARPSALAMEFDRPKQELENFPLDSLQFKGTLSGEGERVALVMAGDRLYQVRTGDYMGTRKGKVLEIAPAALVLREIEPDASGHWKSRNTVLPVIGGDK